LQDLLRHRIARDHLLIHALGADRMVLHVEMLPKAQEHFWLQRMLIFLFQEVLNRLTFAPKNLGRMGDVKEAHAFKELSVVHLSLISPKTVRFFPILGQKLPVFIMGK
jgi:hypothetical protein